MPGRRGEGENPKPPRASLLKSTQNQPRSCGKEGEKRERETDAQSPQEPAKDAWRGGGESGKTKPGAGK